MSALGSTGAPTKAQREESDQRSRIYRALSDDGMSGREIAEMFGVGQASVSRRIRRARAGCGWDFKARGPNRHA